MKQTSREFLTEEQRAGISAAVKQAESSTAGEIVPVLATASDGYERGHFLAAIAFSILTTLAIVALLCLPMWPESLWSTDILPLPIPLIVILVLQLAALITGYRCSSSTPGIHRALIPRATMQRRVDQAAHRAFHQFRLSHTESATGIMIYVSLFEHSVVVLADKAISERHKPDTWDRLRDHLIEGLKNGEPTEGFIKAIQECGQILKVDFPIQTDDTNELPNELRLI